MGWCIQRKCCGVYLMTGILWERKKESLVCMTVHTWAYFTPLVMKLYGVSETALQLLSKTMRQFHLLSGDGSRTLQFPPKVLSSLQLLLFQNTCQNLSFASARQTVRHSAGVACCGACLSVDVKVLACALICNYLCMSTTDYYSG